MSFAHFLNVLNLPPTDKTIDEGGSRLSTDQASKDPSPWHFGLCSRAQEGCCMVKRMTPCKFSPIKGSRNLS